MKEITAIAAVITLTAAGWFLIGWPIMISAGILFNAGVIPASLGWQDSFWLGAVVSVWFGFVAAVAAAVKD